MMLVVKMAKDGGDRRWKIVKVERLRRMEQAVDLLVVLESALLPALALFPDNSSFITASAPTT
uniref:Uncharacterized protein n=1 Tax=Arundo donax TaxID=35708 RepID=A0A0A9C6M6_ARUDO